MTEEGFPTSLIEKLGHNILEIRERALFTILSKLDNGFLLDNNLARTKALIKKLFEWFLYSPSPHEDIVLALIKRILLTENGATIVKHYGTETIQKDLKQVHACIEPKYHSSVEELMGIINKIEKQPCQDVPPLISDVPLSYRTEYSDASTRNSVVESTATAFTGYLSKRTSVDVKNDKRPTPRTGQNAFLSSIKETIGETVPFYTFKWQPLIEADRHVLDSIEKSLRNFSQPASVLNSCDFFTDVLLRDFPAELFLQRPAIILVLQDLLLETHSSRIVNSVSNCFLQLTKSLQKRINHYNDPSMQRLKENCSHTDVFTRNLTSSSVSHSGLFESEEFTDSLKLYEMPTPKFCLTTLKCIVKYLRVVPETIYSPSSKKKQPALNILIIVFRELLILLRQCYKVDIWNATDGPIYEIVRDFCEFFSHFGDLLENYRVEVNAEDDDVKFRALHLCILHDLIFMMDNFIPNEKYNIVPTTLKNAITLSLLDIPVAKLYPQVHNKLLQYAKGFKIDKNNELLSKFTVVKDVCESITATIKFIKNYTSLNFTTTISLANDSILALQFHQNVCFIDILIDLCGTKYPSNCTDLVSSTTEDVVVKLLAHHREHVREYTYELCKKKVISAIGPNMSLAETISSSNIIFLLRPKILIEIAQYGINNPNSKIRLNAEDIIVHLIKCKMLVPSDIWTKAIVAIPPALPMILVHASKQTMLGRMLVNVIDPDTAKDLSISTLDIVKSNTLLLFSRDSRTRDEGFSRIAWMLSGQDDSKRLLPKLNNVHNANMSNVCQLSAKLVDINKTKNKEHFYQPSSLIQVMELLKSSGIEPGIRRSALTQIAVMMEDYLLHDLFLEKFGTAKLLTIFRSALTDDDYLNYPDSVMPIVSVLKNICLYNTTERHELSNNIEVFYCILRSLFLYLTEFRLKQDCSILLFLLLYSSFVKGSPTRGNLSVPYIVNDLLAVPFNSDVYGQISENSDDDLVAFVKSDPNCLSSVQIHWNSELRGGFANLLKFEDNATPRLVTPKLLRLNQNDIKHVKVSNLEFSIRESLEVIQKGVDSDQTVEAINGLVVYVYLYGLTMDKIEGFILKFPWDVVFAKFFKILPSSEEDSTQLLAVLKLLTMIVPYYKLSEEKCWITQSLKDPSSTITDLLEYQTSSDDIKRVGKQLLNLITECVNQEQHYLDFHPESDTDFVNPSSWAGIIETITENLNLNDSQQFYNLAFLDSLLSCLVHLSAALGWSTARRKSSKLTLKQIISGLCDLVDAFHHGKGDTAADSVMGLSITRSALLILNHIIAELNASDLTNWDTLFIDDLNGANKLSHFIALWKTRDIVLKAASMQFFGGLLSSVKLTVEIMSDLKVNNVCLWKMALDILNDHKECSIIRENAAYILANLCSHSLIDIKNVTVACDIYPLSEETVQNNVEKILKFFETNEFYRELKIILYSLYTISKTEIKKKDSTISPCVSPFALSQTDNSLLFGKDEKSNEQYNITTPSMIKAVTVLLFNLSELGGAALVDKLKNEGLVKLIFRCICYPSTKIKNTRDVAFYCEILDMDVIVCLFLSKCARLSLQCLGTILHTKDCINVLVALLNTEIYHTYLPQLLYLRNKLWTEVYNLIVALLEPIIKMEKSDRLLEVLITISEAIHLLGPPVFLETLCRSIGSLSSTDLQKSALNCLVFLLQAETSNNALKNSSDSKMDFVKKYSMQNLLDTTKIKLSFNAKQQEKLPDNSMKSLYKFKMNKLENLYFSRKCAEKNKTAAENEKKILAGAELSKILLHLYHIFGLATIKENVKNNTIFSAISSILCVSNEAKNFALDEGFLQEIVDNIKEIYINLSLESADCFRRVSDRKRVAPLLKHLDVVIGLINNFLLENVSAKCQAVTLGLADKVHKLWVWFNLQRSSLLNVLKMLSTFTTNCPYACQSLPYTSPLVGTGPRKVANNVSLLNAIMSLISKEMDHLSKTHDVMTLQLCFNILCNASSVLECRMAITKGAFIQSITRLHPAITKHQKPWDVVELIWLDFLQSFTIYPEGQMYVGKLHDVLELFITLASGGKQLNQLAALVVLQNVAFYTPNRSRLLTTDDFINLLFTKLESGTIKEKNVVVTIMWALAANNTKAKSIFKSAKLDCKLSDLLKKLHIYGSRGLSEKETEKMRYVLDILHD